MTVVEAVLFNDRWADGIGTRWMFTTAAGDAFGDGKWQVAPIGRFRCLFPEISNATFAEVVLWWDTVAPPVLTEEDKRKLEDAYRAQQDAN